MSAPLVIGVGHPDRGDDAIGPLVIDAVHAARPDLDVARLADPLALIDVVDGRDLAVVVDGAVTGSALGAVRVFEAGESPLPSRPAFPTTSSHGLSLSDAIELARAVGALPSRLAVVTVEVGSVTLGEPAQQSVLAAVARAATEVVSLLERADGRSDPHR